MQQRILNLARKPTYEVADFFVSACNKIAFEWVRSWPKWPFHCLILSGPKGCGKTHLSKIWAEQSQAKALDFDSLKDLNLDEFCANATAIIIEDLPLNFNEELLFHLYNVIRQAEKYLMITSEVSPNEWNLELPDLQSRLRASIWVGIEPADNDLLRAMLHKIFADAQVRVEDTIIEYLLNHYERSFEAIQEAAEHINTFAFATKRKITLPLVKEVLEII